MNDEALTIARRLETSFMVRGFAGMTADEICRDAGLDHQVVSRHFPTLEAIIIGVLDNRHRTYVDLILDTMPHEPGPRPVRYVFEQLGMWIETRSSKGCLFMKALAAYPDCEALQDAIARHKELSQTMLLEAVRRAFPGFAEDKRERLMQRFFLIHEGQGTLSITKGAEAATKATLSQVAGILARTGMGADVSAGPCAK